MSEAVLPDKLAMKSILERFHAAAESTASTLVRESISGDQDALDVLTMAKTKTGIRQGEWETRVNNKRWSVCNVDTSTPIIADMWLKESAMCIMRLLNKGVYINDSRIAKAMYLDGEFGTRLTECANYKRLYEHAKRTGDSFKQELNETRHSEAKHLALRLKSQITRL